MGNKPFKGTMQWDFDDFITHNSKILAAKLFFFFLAAKNARILHKNDCEKSTAFCFKKQAKK